MFDYESISKLNKANVSAINSATTSFASSMMTLAYKNYTDMMDAMENNPVSSVCSSWFKLMDEQTKTFTNLWDKETKKAQTE